MNTEDGLHEQLVTRALEEALSHRDLLEERESLGDAAPEVLARYLHDLALRVLRDTTKGKAPSQLDARLALANRLVETLAELAPKLVEVSAVATHELLLSLMSRTDAALGKGVLPRPEIPLRHSDLIVNGPRDRRVGLEIQRELLSADRVDLLMSFIKWNGLIELRDSLVDLRERRGKRLRVLTTSYMRATEPEALEELARLGAEIRVSYDTRRTRLHAKAWLFHRKTGFSTGLIGSSNLSRAALRDGCEWNVRLSNEDNHPLLRKFETTFDQYWEDPTFEAFEEERFREEIEPSRARDLSRDALARHVDLRPYPHQQTVLDQLEAERERGHHHNLVIAATGTGKTVTAALDYARQDGRPSLLFVAHRQEILQQSKGTFQAALRDGHFGETLAGGHRPVRGTHVFASVQSLHAERLKELPPDAFDFVVVDEFHHASAPTYRALLEHLRPRTLLGLTATPERADGQSILEFFDGRIAAESRLWDALDHGLLSPFQYFVLADSVDLRDVDYRRGRYDVAALDAVYTGDEARARQVVRAVASKVRRPHEMRALGFCVSVRHAEFMKAYFDSKGLPAAAVTGNTNEADRADALRRLARGDICCIFSVDVFNEGVDIPEVDTVLFLRPTESATVFVQQLGRGLRLHEDKSCLTVLDFVGEGRRERFDLKLRALVGGGTRAELANAVERGFPTLPSGCSIQFEEQPQRVILEGLRRALKSWAALAADLEPEMSLGEFLARAELSPEELYRSHKTFEQLRVAKGLVEDAPSGTLAKSLSRLLHVDDDRLTVWSEWLRERAPPAADPHDPLQGMLFAAMGQARERSFHDLAEFLEELWDEEPTKRELLELLSVLADRVRRRTLEVPGFPLRVHAHYTRFEVMGALGLSTSKTGKLRTIQQGVYRCEEHHCDLLFVTLEKDAKNFTPTTLYEDYPISPRLFHWETQGATKAASATGRRYRHPPPGWRIHLFVRHASKDERGITSPFLFLGPVFYESHESERPMRITWRIEHAMPPEWFQSAKIAAG